MYSLATKVWNCHVCKPGTWEVANSKHSCSAWMCKGNLGSQQSWWCSNDMLLGKSCPFSMMNKKFQQKCAFTIVQNTLTRQIFLVACKIKSTSRCGFGCLKHNWKQFYISDSWWFFLTIYMLNFSAETKTCTCIYNGCLALIQYLNQSWFIINWLLRNTSMKLHKTYHISIHTIKSGSFVGQYILSLRGLWANDFRKDCSLECVITQNQKQILTFSFFCCVDKHPKSITSCKNLWFSSQWLCYSVWDKTPVFRNSGFNSETILPISIFLFDNDTYMLSPLNGIRVCQLEL